MTSKWQKRSRIWLTCGRNWWKTLILMSPHHFLITCIWDVLNVNANQMKSLLNSIQRCSNHVFLLEQRKFTGMGNSHAKTVAWSCDMEGHAQKWVERYCQLATQKVEQLNKVSSPCLNDHQFKKEELESVGELSNVCSQIVLKCLARIGRTGRFMVSQQVANQSQNDSGMWQTLGNVDFLHSSHKWLPTCATRLSIVESVLFQDSDFAGDLEDSTSTSGGVLCIFGKSNICHYQLDVQETSVSIPQFYRVWNWMLDYDWMDFFLSTSGVWQPKCCDRQATLREQLD